MFTFANADNMPTAMQTAKPGSIQEQLAQLESYFGERISAYAINTADNAQIQYHVDERFQFCSTSTVQLLLICVIYILLCGVLLIQL